jgi:hypothetical protein
VWACVLLYVSACSSGNTEMPTPVMNWPQPEPLQWVDPARCSSPCLYEAAGHLVQVDVSARLAPGSLQRTLDVAQPAMEAMIAEAAAAGYAVGIRSAFRTYNEQLQLFQTETEIGRTARPGHSEHQLGTAVDLDATDDGYAWLAARCADYGFVLSFPIGKQKITGIRYESWHFRYVGTDIAKAVRDETGTLEQFFRAHPDKAIVGDCTDCPLDLSRNPCGSVQPEGQCTGSVLTWCFDGTTVDIDCAATGLTCDPQPPDADCR